MLPRSGSSSSSDSPTRPGPMQSDQSQEGRREQHAAWCGRSTCRASVLANGNMKNKPKNRQKREKKNKIKTKQNSEDKRRTCNMQQRCENCILINSHLVSLSPSISVSLMCLCVSIYIVCVCVWCDMRSINDSNGRVGQ